MVGLQPWGKGDFASLWWSTINASVQCSIACASVEVCRISLAAWWVYSSCRNGVFVESEPREVLKAKSNHQGRGYLNSFWAKFKLESLASHFGALALPAQLCRLTWPRQIVHGRSSSFWCSNLYVYWGRDAPPFLLDLCHAWKPFCHCETVERSLLLPKDQNVWVRIRLYKSLEAVVGGIRTEPCDAWWCATSSTSLWKLNSGGHWSMKFACCFCWCQELNLIITFMHLHQMHQHGPHCCTRLVRRWEGAGIQDC